MSIRVLLDTNVWAYVAADDAAKDLRGIARSSDLEILVSPAVVFEQLRYTQRPDVRKRQLDITTRDWWTRMMPEVHVECEELVASLRRHRPNWIVASPTSSSLREYHRNRSDWKHGFWQRARKTPDRQASYNDQLGGYAIEAGREHIESKKSFAREHKIGLASISLADPTLTDCLVHVGGGEPLQTQRWRVDASAHVAHQLANVRPGNRTFRDWLDPFLKYDEVASPSAWLSFWMEVDPAEVPTQWLYWAAATLAPLVKVNSGTVFDVQIAVYLSHADVFMTADKNFDRIAQILQRYAPFPVARPVRTSAISWRSDLLSLADRTSQRDIG